MSNDILVQTCSATAQAATDALRWFDDAENEELVGAVRPQLRREFRRFSTQAKTLAGAVDRPMCVGLFGPSQAGKSYLAAGLSRKGSAPLKVRFGGEGEKNFLNQINPEGDRESTGVVTRFSLNDVPHPDGFPVALRLLSETDVIKILGNSYFLDSDPKVLKPLEKDHLAEITAAARAQAGSGDGTFSVEQIWDIQEYFQKEFGHLSPMSVLSDYWKDIEELAPKLDLPGRAALFSPLWGAFDRLTETYELLASALAQLGYPTDAFAGIDALIPRSKSIIDVETLLGLGSPDADTLAVRTMQGAPITLPRPVVTALIAELQLTITEKPWDLFDHTDLLDFPGARNRAPLDLGELLQKEDALKQLLVRGKVAYLFDRYVADQELTSMLLCVKPSNQDITSLPSLVSEWIERTHGAAPEDRAGRPTLLFFILGWFNEHLKRLPGEDEGDLGTRYKSRIHGALPEFFGKSYDWPDQWASGKPFQNCFWLRDPGFSTQTFESEDGVEIGVKSQEKDRIDRMKQAYLEVDEVKRHFADPGDAWDKAMLPKDGGVSHLANSLAPVCEPDMKRRQVQGRIDDLRRQMTAQLQPYFVSDDVDKRIAERRVVAEDVLVAVEDAAHARKFGKLLRSFQMQEGALQESLYRFSRQPATVEEVKEEDPAPRRSGRFSYGAETVAAPAPKPAVPVKDKNTLIADEIVRAWTQAIGERADNERLARTLGISNDHLKEIVAELVSGARRLDLAERIAAEMRRFTFADGNERAVARNAVIGSRQINAFVSRLGFDTVAEQDRPTAPNENGDPEPVFKVPPFVTNTIQLPSVPRLPEDVFLDNWAFAYMRFVDDNASSSKGQSVNRKQNNALGRILTVLDGSFTAKEPQNVD